MADQPHLAPVADGTQRAVIVEQRPSGLIKIKKAARTIRPPQQISAKSKAGEKEID